MYLKRKKVIFNVFVNTKSISISAVKQLIASKIKAFTYMCVCTVYIYYVYIYIYLYIY